MFVLMQGDAYKVPVTLLSPDNTALTPEDLADVEITIGSLTRTYSDGGVVYENGEWLVPLTQMETFKLPVARIKAQVRVKWPDGRVEGQQLGHISIDESSSKGVL